MLTNKVIQFVMPSEMKDDSMGFEFSNEYQEEIDNIENLIKKDYPHLTIYQVTDIGERPIQMKIETTQQSSFNDDINTIFDKVIQEVNTIMVSEIVTKFYTTIMYDSISLEFPQKYNDKITGIEKTVKSSYPHLDMEIDEDGDEITVIIDTEKPDIFIDDINTLFEGI